VISYLPFSVYCLPPHNLCQLVVREDNISTNQFGGPSRLFERVGEYFENSRNFRDLRCYLRVSQRNQRTRCPCATQFSDWLRANSSCTHLPIAEPSLPLRLGGGGNAKSKPIPCGGVVLRAVDVPILRKPWRDSSIALSQRAHRRETNCCFGYLFNLQDDLLSSRSISARPAQ
jgi:hypothetical protein